MIEVKYVKLPLFLSKYIRFYGEIIPNILLSGFFVGVSFAVTKRVSK